MSASSEVLIQGMKGLGDNIYQRIFVRAAAARATTYLETPWPELYADLPVRFVKVPTPLRTQHKNVDRQREALWERPPSGAHTVRIAYGRDMLQGSGSIVGSMESALPLDGAPFVMDMPRFGEPPVKAQRPIALIRPVTVRSEWRNEARNPLPEYVAEIARALMSDHHVVSVADLETGKEWLLEPAPPAHTVFHGGELAFPELMALLQHSSIVVGGIGWIVPAAIAAKAPAFIVLGGQGGHNAPEKITDPRMDLSRIGWAVPDNYCRCTDMRHQRCDKRISNLMEQFDRWRRRHEP